MSDVITKDVLVRSLPAQHGARVTDEMVNAINQIQADDSFKEVYREGILGYSSVLAQGQFPMGKYLDAVRYVSYYLMNNTQVRSYELAFPERYRRLVIDEGKNDKEVSAYANIYHRGKLVTQILTQARVPVSLLNADKFQMAVNVNAELMVSAKSEMVRMQAANSLLTHLKPPEDAKIELDIGQSTAGSIIGQLTDTLHKMSQQQVGMVAAGMGSSKSLAADPIILENKADGAD